MEQETPPLDAVRAVLRRLADRDVRLRVQKTLVLWELGYVREALSQFRVTAEDALRRLLLREGGEAQRSLELALERGQSARVIEALYREREAIPARIALHLHTLLAWGNYASHHQRLGHHARSSDLELLVSIAVDLEDWMAIEHDGGPSVFEGSDQAWVLHQVEGHTAESGLDPEVARACLACSDAGVRVDPHRLLMPSRSLELYWRRPQALPPADPYRGLCAFEPEDVDRFYGRSMLIDELEAVVDTQRLTIVSGASGSGKTSLLRAGLIPRLLDLRCGVVTLSDYSEQGWSAVARIIESWPDRPLALILDQFERALLPGVAPQLLEHVLRQVMTIAPERAGLRVVLGMREDYLGRLFRAARAHDVGRVLPEGHAIFVVGPLTGDEAREAITRPLEGCGVVYEEELLQRALLPELVEEAGTLPARLQIVCGRLFAEARARGQGTIDRALYDRLGGAQRVLASHLDETLASPRYEGQRELAHAVLRAMTDEDTRRWVDLGELWIRVRPALPSADELQISGVLERLVDDRLVISRSGPSSERAEHTLLHDQLAVAARALTSAAELEVQLAQEQLDRALTVWSDPRRRELLPGRALRLVEQHWARLSRPRREAEELLAASRRGRRSRRVGLAMLLGTALFGLAFGAVQLRRAMVERDRAALTADQGVLLQAQLALEHDPTLSLAWLRNLSEASSGLGVLTLVEEARRRGASVVLAGHEHLVTSVAFAPDGQRLVSASRDHTLRLWDLRRRAALGPPLRGHGDFVNRVAFSPDGRLIASASSDRTVRLWDAATGRPLRVLRGHDGAVYGLDFAPDGRSLASGGADRTIRIWSLVGGARPRSWAGHTAEVMAVAFSPDGRQLASASLDRSVVLWSVERGAPDGAPLRGHGQGVYAVAFSPDGSRLASAGRDSTVRLWSVAGHTAERVLAGHSDWVLAVAFSADGATLATAGSDKVVRLWATASGSPRGVLRGHLGFIHGVAFSRDGRAVASASRDQTVRVWDLSTWRTPGFRLRGHSQEVRSLAFSPDGRTLASASKDRSVQLWDRALRQPRGAALPHADEVLCVAFSADGKVLASGGGGRRLTLWQTAGRPLAPVEAQAQPAGTQGTIIALAYARDGRTLAASDSEGTIQLWDVAAGRWRATLLGHVGAVHALTYGADGAMLISAGADRTIQLWSGASGALLGALGRHGDTIFALALSPDGATLASGGADGRIQLWDLHRRRPIGPPLLGHRHWVLSLAFAPDGRTLASGSSDGTVRLWDTRRRAQIGPPLLGHDDWVYAVVFAPDGATLASGSADRTVWLRHLARVDLEQLQQLIDSLTNVRVSLDGRTEVW